jgi:hypothetical protein
LSAERQDVQVKSLRSYKTIAGSIGTFLWFLWEAYSHFQTAEQVPTDARKLLHVFEQSPPWFVLIPFVALFVWGVLPRRQKAVADAGPVPVRPPDPHENVRQFQRISADAQGQIGSAVAANTALRYEMALSDIEPIFLLLKQAKIPIPELHSDGAKAGVLRANRYLNTVRPPLSIGDEQAARTLARECVPRLNSMSEEELWRDVCEAFPPVDSGPIRDRTGVIEAALYMFFHDWAHTLSDLTATDQITMLSGNCLQMVQDAVDENLIIWVRRDRHHGSHIDPGSAYWQNQSIDWCEALRGEPKTNAVHGSKLEEAYDPLVRKSDIERLYGPAKS